MSQECRTQPTHPIIYRKSTRFHAVRVAFLRCVTCSRSLGVIVGWCWWAQIKGAGADGDLRIRWALKLKQHKYTELWLIVLVFAEKRECLKKKKKKVQMRSCCSPLSLWLLPLMRVLSSSLSAVLGWFPHWCTLTVSEGVVFQGWILPCIYRLLRPGDAAFGCISGAEMWRKRGGVEEKPQLTVGHRDIDRGLVAL